MNRVPDENVRRFRQDLLRLIAALRARGVEPVLVTHATAFGKELSGEDHELLVAWRKFYPMLDENGFLDMEQRMNGAIRDVAAQEHVSLIDAARELPRGREYFGDFSHFTSMCAEVMATRLADGLRPLIDARLPRSEEHTSELQSRPHLVCRLLLEKKKYHNANSQIQLVHPVTVSYRLRRHDHLTLC